MKRRKKIAPRYSPSAYSVEQAMADTGCPRAIMIALFKTLDSEGVATYKRGCKGYSTRIERWG